MTEETNVPESKKSPESSLNAPPTPLRCLLGSIVAGVFSFLAWNLTQSIAVAFAARQITSDNMIVIRISIAVRTLVVGLTTFGAGIFGLAAIGLLGLAIQLLLTKKQSPEA